MSDALKGQISKKSNGDFSALPVVKEIAYFNRRRSRLLAIDGHHH
jgi:hypothetical protein